MKLDVQAYYQQLTAIDIGAIARELLQGRITEDSRAELKCDCPHHQSASKISLRVSLHEGLWHCFGCRKGGDVLQLVEFVFYGDVTKGVRGAMADSHRAARDWLAARAGLPPLARADLSPAELGALEAKRLQEEAVFRALTALAQLYHEALLANEKALAWIRSTYGISDRMIETLRIGWADDPAAFRKLERQGFDPRVISSTGAFNFDAQDNPHPFFRARAVFPYWSRGRVVYMIGRRSPWSPADDFERAKYKKLPVYNEGSRSYVSPAIDNSVLWGEDILLGRPERVILTEGVTDAIAAQQAGFPCISPVTVRLRAEDVERIVRRLKGVQTVYLLQDNELSGIGLEAGLSTARIFAREGIKCLIATLPLGPKQATAREVLTNMIGAAEMAAVMRAQTKDRGRMLREALVGREAEHEKADDLLSDSKIDLCEWFLSIGSPEELERILSEAREPVEVSIDLLPKLEDAEQQVRAAEPILAEIGQLREAAKDKYLKRLREHTGLSMKILRAESAALSKTARRDSGNGRARSAPASSASARPSSQQIPPGGCRELVESELSGARAAQEAPSWEGIAERVYEWFEQHGAQFFRTRSGEPFMFFENEVWPMSPFDTGPRKRFEGLIYRLTGLVPTTSGPRTFYSVLSALASDRGQVRDQFPWVHTDVLGLRIHLNMNNDRHEIASISADGIDIVPNGTNAEGIILRGDAKFAPFNFCEEAAGDELDALLDETIGQHLACADESRRPLLDWLCCFPLVEFAGTRPMVRLEGQSGSGKTWAAKMLTTLVYGSDEQKKSTDAANYADAARNPVVALDNVETENTTPALLDFLLTSVTGITREKRAGGTDSATISERPLCIILSTGVEPLGGELEEVMSRSIVFEFDTMLQGEPKREKHLLAALKAQRDLLLSALLRRTSTILALMREGGHERAMAAIRRSLGAHGKRRCDEFLALMYLHRVAAAPAEDRDLMLDLLDERFESSIGAMTDATNRTARDASPVATGLLSLFTALRNIPMIGDRFGLVTNDISTIIVDAPAAQIFLALRKVAKDRGSPCPFKNAVQFGKRLNGSIELLRQQGFEVTSRLNAHRSRIYSIVFDGRSGALSSSRAGEGTYQHESAEQGPRWERGGD